MQFEKATTADIPALVALRLAYLQEDLSELSAEDAHNIASLLPGYYRKHLEQDLFVYVAREGADIAACAFLLVVEKPMSPSFPTGKTGTVLNVYTRPASRRKGYAKRLMEMMLEDARAQQLSVIELKATEDGYPLYRAVGFGDVTAKYHNMKITLY